MTREFSPRVYSVASGLAIVLFFMISLVNLPKYSLTTDEMHVLWRGQMAMTAAAAMFEGEKPFSEKREATYWSQFHPPLYGMMNAVASSFFERNGLEPIEAQHFLGVIWSTVGLVFLFLLARRLFGPAVGFYSVLFMMLLPRFVAHAQYNEKDIPAMVWAVICLYFSVRSLETRSIVSAAAAGVCLGCGIATSLNVLFLVPVIAAAAFVQGKPSWRQIAWIFGAGLVSMWLAWPQLWVKPLYVIEGIRHFSGNAWWSLNVLYFGKIYTGAQLPWHYTPMHVLLATPVPIILLAGAGLFFGAHGRFKENRLAHVILLSWFLLPILARSRPGVMRYDEMRHVFISMPPFMIYAAFGWQKVLSWLAGRIPSTAVWAAPVLTLALAWHLFSQVRLVHPFEGSYYNEAVRLFIPAHIERFLPMMPWATATRPVIDWFDAHAEPYSVICLHGELDAGFYEHRYDLVFNCGPNPDYVVFLTNFQWRDEIARLSDQTPVLTVSRMNSDLFYIYKSTTAHAH